jgi:hypothetical protein
VVNNADNEARLGFGWHSVNEADTVFGIMDGSSGYENVTCAAVCAVQVWAVSRNGQTFVRCGIADGLLFGTHWSPVSCCEFH